MGNFQALSIVSGIVLALIGYAATYINSVRLEKRKARFNFVSSQLQNLYGPLFSLNATGKTAWQAFRSKCRPNGAFFGDPPPTKEELKSWRLWMTEVFMPINIKMQNAIIENAHLIEGQEMPNSMKQFLAHVEIYRVIVKQWQNDDFSSQRSYVKFPREFEVELEETFLMLKERQLYLMGKTFKADGR